MDEFFLHPNTFFLHPNKKFWYHNCPYMRTGWHPIRLSFKKNWQPDDTPIRLSFFFKWQPDGVSSGSHFQIKMITRWNSSGSHSPNRKINPFSIWTTRTGWVSSGYHFDLEMRTGWHSHPVVNFFSNDNRIGVPSGFHIRAIVILNFFIRVQEELVFYVSIQNGLKGRPNSSINDNDMLRLL